MSIAPNDIFGKLMALGPPNTISVPKALRRIGSLVDLAGDLDKEDGTARALEWCDELSRRKLTKRQEALLDYFRANAWANRQRSKHHNVDAAWQWDQPELQQQVLHLRRALQSAGFAKLSPLRRISTCSGRLGAPAPIFILVIFRFGATMELGRSERTSHGVDAANTPDRKPR